MSEKVSHGESSTELRTWLAGLGSYSGPDTLLGFTKAPEGCIDLTHAHPSGLAQLLAGRRTRLSTLIRDASQYAVAVRIAGTLRAKIFELGSDRGIDVGYLAAGTASWTNATRIDGAGSNTSAAEPHHVCAPVLLTAIVLTARPGQDDYELQLTEQARLNPALVRSLRQVHGIELEPLSLARLAYSTARFNPAPVLERLRALVQPIKGAVVEHHLLVSTFADLAENLHDAALLSGNPFIEALSSAGHDDGAGAVRSALHEAEGPGESDRFPPLDAREPHEELLVLDADTGQQQVLDMIRAGDSLVVSAPPGTGQTQTAINAIAALAFDGKTVLVIGERRTTLNELAQRFSDLGLAELLLQLSAQTGPQQLKSALVRAIVRNEKAAEPKLTNLHRTLTEHRHQLMDHVASLHDVRQRWGCSPYQAMQSLAELTSIHPAPSTTVRLKRSVLDSIADRDELAGRLRRAAELGSFSKSATSSAWHGARLVTRKETEEAHALASGLLAQLPEFARKISEMTEFSQIRQGHTFIEWGEQLELLVAVRESLDKFTPDIFDRPVTDLISATASSGWRRERNVEMAAMQRSRLRRVAKEYIRPGVHISDLHTSLVLVQEQRAVWGNYATTERHPAVPSGLADLRAAHTELGGALQQLGLAVERTAAGGGLESTGFDELIARLQALVDDKETLQTLPERTLLLESMRGHGLGELLDDLADREVAPAGTRTELELAWWQSALEAMISGDDYLAMSDGDNLRRVEAEFRLADQAHVVSGSSRLRWRLAQKWNSTVSGRNRQGELLRNLLKDGRVTLDALAAQAPDLLANLLPVWATSPLMLPSVVPAGQRFDAVIILDAESTSLQAALPSIARARQVIAFGDEQTAAPRAFSVAVEKVAPGEEDSQRPESIFGALANVLPGRRLGVSYRAVDEELVLQLSKDFYDGQLERMPDGRTVTGLDRSLVVDYLPDGTGLPGTGIDGVESVVAEVNRVVDLVFEHARVRPLSSLAVVTASERHAVRVAQAIRMQMPNHPLLSEFFASSAESFRVVTVNRAAGLVRDHVIFSLGYGRTPHGRALHNFGPLSASDGRAKFALAMTRAREHLQIITCFRPEDLDEARLSHGARDFYELLDRELAGNSRLGTTASRAAASEQALGEDALVADLAERLRARGARVWHHYDGVVDMVAASDPLQNLGKQDDEIPTPVAVESDGTAKYQGMSVRERSRLRPQLLERLGWRYMPLWTIEVFTDPSLCADLIGGYLGLSPTLNEGELSSLLGPAPAARPSARVAIPDEDGFGAGESGKQGSPAQGQEAMTGSPERVSSDAESAELEVPQKSDGTASTGTASTGSASAGSLAAGSASAGTLSTGVIGPSAGRSADTPESNDEAEPVVAAGSGQNTDVVGLELGTQMGRQAGTQMGTQMGSASEKDNGFAPGSASEKDNDSATEPQARAEAAEPAPSKEAEPLLPTVAAKDDPRAWGDKTEEGHDDWLKEQRPPHWG
ncbi:AAA family ATPase [Paeniglutamicibacter antarcticus]|uniref:AAA family ATPase n=1 Tax=Arthrobacter terrae TaxID=2935737 RepID=A0A931CRY7_9MICC|nr:AAA family ATPase [Arthrobacter terrae]MBG0741335.1 AAA family ATPase [Arthrobacter terrae]